MLDSSRPAPGWWRSPGTEPILYAAASRLVALFDLRACRFEPFPFDAQLPRIEPGRIVLPPAEPGIATWSGEPGVELPVRYCGLTVGRFVLVGPEPTTGVRFAPADRAAAIALAADLGAVVAAAMLADTSDGACRDGIDGPIVTATPPEPAGPVARSHRRSKSRHHGRSS